MGTELEDEVVLVVDVARVVLVPALVLVLLWGGVDPPAESLTVTTLFAGKATFTDPPETVTDVDANVWLLSINQAEAEPGVKPENDAAPVCWEVPLFVKTMTMVPSEFLYAPVLTPLMEPETDRANAPGRM